MANWGAFKPLSDNDGASSHLQAPPSCQVGTLDLDFDARDFSVCEELLDELSELREGSAFDVLDVVTKYLAPIAILRHTVERWHDALPAGHALKEPAEDVKLTLFPEYAFETVQPFRSKQPVWDDEAPALEPLIALAFVCTGCMVSFAILEPPCADAVFLKEAQQRVAWTRHALFTCRDFVQAAKADPVCLVAGPRAQQALPSVMRWLRELEFWVQGSLIKSRCFTSNSSC